MSAPDPVLRLIVHGTPGTSGSKSSFPIYIGSGADRRFSGRVATVQDDKAGNSRQWRQEVSRTAFEAIRCSCDDPGCTALRAGYPLDEALVVSMVFTVRKPASAPKTTVTYPVAKPDALKYGRATEDALKDAGVMRDDARVVEYGRLAKVYPGEDPGALPAPGAIVMIWRRSQLPRIPSGTVPSLLAPGTLFEVNGS